MNEISTDVIIIGAGPCGLFTVFEAGLLKWRCHLIDYLPAPGGQCAEIYPKKPIYDIPGFPSVLAGELVDNLMEQAKPFSPTFSLGERAESMTRNDDGTFTVVTSRGTHVHGKTIFIAGGLGCFEPRKPMIENIVDFEDKGVDYIIRDPEVYRNKKVVIGGGGDSALDWTIVLAEIASEVTLVHRSQTFRAAPDSVQKAEDLSASGKITIRKDSQVLELHGNGVLSQVGIKNAQGETVLQDADAFIPLFGLSPKLGPIGEWGLQLDRNAITVDPLTFMTSEPGVYAVGDIAEYPNKLKLILCGFHEASVALHVEYQRQNPNKKHVMKYTTVTGITGL